MIGKYLELLGQASLAAAVMILAVILLRVRFRGRTPQRVYCLLWDIVLLRLLAPVRIVSPFSIQGLRTPPQNAVPMITAVPTVPITVVEDTAAEANAMCDVSLPLLWCAGMLLCAVWLLWGHLQSRSLYAMSLPIEDSFVRQWQEQHPLRRFVQVRRSDRISAPLTYGVLQPVVLLPSRMDLTNREDLSYVLAHEYTHIRRFDALRKCLLAAGLCLHWFNPLVWLMYILANRDIELACDEAVVRAGADRRNYALALLRLEEERGGAFLSGSHFSGHALEERITSIMKHKNVSIAALFAIAAAMSVTTTVFATSAPADKQVPPSGSVTGREIAAVSQDVLTISKGGADGEPYFSLDGGETWMDEEQYHAQYGGNDWQVEWWTYEAYKAWLEQEKKELASIIGSRGYTSSRGWFVWDQKMVDETIAMYEETLEGIKNGMLYSKSITSANGEVQENAVLASGWDINTAYVIEESSVSPDQTQAAQHTAVNTAALLKSFQAFGVTGTEEDGLYYNGQPIRYLVDGYETDNGCAISYVYANENGTVDVHTLRDEIPLPGGGVDPAGPLKAIVKKGGQGYCPSLFDCVLWDGSEAVTTASASGTGGRTLEEIFASFSPWGLQYNPDASHAEILTYNGQPAASFADVKPDGSVFSYSNPYTDSGVKVYTEYDKNGKLIGLTTV